MNPDETKELYLAAAAATGTSPSQAQLDTWIWLMVDLDPAAARYVLAQHLRTSAFMPKPAEIIQPALKLAEPEGPPSLEAATGYYMAGRWGEHPLVLKAAKSVYWDRHEMPEKARWEFRDHYQAALHGDERSKRDAKRQELYGNFFESLDDGDTPPELEAGDDE